MKIHLSEGRPVVQGRFDEQSDDRIRRTDPGRVVVGFLDELFTRFDELAADAGVEKIKTVGLDP